MHPSSYVNMERFVNQYLSALQETRLEIIDIGSQDINGSYKPIFQNPKWHYTGADIVKGNNVDLVIESMYNWSNIRSNSYDFVISGQTFEHIEYFWFTILEIARILKAGGICCIIAPSSGEEHRYPVDCWRFYPDGFKSLACYSGLQMNSVYCDETDIWKDMVLICRKPHLKLSQKFKFNLKNKLSLFIAESLNI